MGRKSAAPSVHVVLDTNSLFNEAADKLVSSELSSFIQKTIPELGTQLQWYIPNIVKGERRFQMIERASRLLPSLVKLEQLLGHALGITAEVLKSRVDEAISRQIELHHLKEIAPRYSEINWEQVVSAAIMRIPPFDSGEKEKGFRDAIILESFVQLAESLPRSPATTRIVLLTGDKLLSDATQARTSDHSNVTIAADLDSLKSLLNAIAAELTQEVVEKIVPRASDLFFRPQDQDTLYYRWEIRKAIEQDFRAEIREAPETNLSVRWEKTAVGPTTFISKQRQRLTLSTKVVLDVVAYERVAQPTLTQRSQFGLFADTPLVSNPLFRTSGPNPLSNPGLYTPSQPVNVLGGLVPQAPIAEYTWTDVVRRRGSKSFDVTWNVTLVRNGSLSNPKLDKIELRSTLWEEK